MQVYTSLLMFIALISLEFCRSLSVTCPVVRSKENCIQVNTWEEFESAISSSVSNDFLVFCPFQVVKSNTSWLKLNKNVTLACQEQRSCLISSMMNSEGRLLKVQGDESQIIVSGFVFQILNISRFAIHISREEGLGSLPVFCACEFTSFKGFHDGAIILRSDSGTIVRFNSCLFHSTLSAAILNRGKMIIEKSIFHNYVGISIVSSRNSELALMDNKFTNDSNDIELVPIDSRGNFIDMGGNMAMDYNKCNGTYISVEHRCISFKTYDDQRMKTVTSAEQNRLDYDNSGQLSTCSSFHELQEPCLNVIDFPSLKHVVYKADAGSTLLFCSFVVTKTENELLYIEKEVYMGCIGGECKITGPGHHILVRSVTTSRVLIQGFTFENSTSTALKIVGNSELVLCGCIFMHNKGGSSRGTALLAERMTKSYIEDCIFESNYSSDMGGSIFNRGFMKIVSSTFRYNIGTGSAIAVAPWASLLLANSQFYLNTYGPPILIHENTLIDLGGNAATDNDTCNGIVIQRQRNLCVSFNTTESNLFNTSASPSISWNPTDQPSEKSREKEGYFNYDLMDDVYGPSHWGDVKNNPEFLRYEELGNTLQRSLQNKCDRIDILQSPIDICENKINSECYEHHQTRTHEGNMMFGDSITVQILPSKLRMKYHRDRTPEGGPYPPEGDFAHNWNGYAEVNHIDVKIPSEHTLCGKKYPGEYQVFMLHPLRRQTIVMSILLDISQEGNDNIHFQKAIDEWQKVYDANALTCDPSYTTGIVSPQNRQAINYTVTGRELVEDDSPYGKGGWDPFHPTLQTSIYHWGYWGSLTEAPCSNFVAWRILTEPAFISERQLQQLRSILFTNVDRNTCEYTAVNDASVGVARPIQEFRNRPLYKCTASDYVSDAEKARMRKETGNPNWCC